MKRRTFARVATLAAAAGRLVVAGLAAAASLASAARADEGRGRAPLLPLYAQECGSCHVAFPPALLHATSWERVMHGLPRHYGTDASLDATLAAQITTWLRANGGTGRRVQDAPPEDRITRGVWFRREHDELPADIWKRAAIGSAANCGACHPRAAEGRYSERDIRIPK